MSPSASQVATELSQFLHLATYLWRQYQAVGPGKVDSLLYDGLDQKAKQLSTSLDMKAKTDVGRLLGVDETSWARDLLEAIQAVLGLAKRCTCSPQGLCFVTGEAGLIPNRQQHREFENQLVNLRHQLEQLAGTND